MSKAICITGMHRSGTSLTASWLEKCGLTMFNKMPGATGNELGHFEDLEIVKLHSSVIKRCCGKNSKGWIVNSRSVLYFNQKEKELAKKIYSNKADIGIPWAWKDPRTVLFLHEWKEICPEIRILFIWRPCLNVVDSLIRRSETAKTKVFKISVWQAFQNWIVYNNKLLDFKKQHPDNIIIVPLDLIIKKNHNFYNFLAQQFGFQLTYNSIDKLYRSKMLKNDNKYGITIKFFSKIFKYSIIEKKLTSSSIKL